MHYLPSSQLVHNVHVVLHFLFPLLALTSNPKPRVIHVLVALCDNKYQGIVPVPARIGNGDDLVDNLYWGADYGVKSFFKRDRSWEIVSDTKNPRPYILERVVFRRKGQAAYMVADAYRGREIKLATTNLFRFLSGNAVETISFAEGTSTRRLDIGAGSDLVAYVGHDGLMNFKVDTPSHADGRHRRAVILACASKNYFAEGVRKAGAEPLLWTTDLMAPEAYTLKAAVDGWLAGATGKQIRESTAVAYNKYQHCGMRGARNLFASGW